MKLLRCYVAGPLNTSGNVAENVRNAMKAGQAMMEFSNRALVPFVPHLFHYWDIVFPNESNFWLHMDEAWLQKCDVLLRLPGDSRGADLEELWAERMGIPIVTSIEELHHWWLENG